MLIYANPTQHGAPSVKIKTRRPRRASKQKGEVMAKRKRPRSKIRKAVSRRRVTRNPATTSVVSRKRHHALSPRRRKHRNPGLLSGGKGILKELMSSEGLIMIGAAFATPMVIDYVGEKIIPASVTGWAKIAAKGVLVGAGAWAIDKFLKQRKAALTFGVVGAAVVASDAVRLYRARDLVATSGLSDGQADYLAQRPELLNAIMNQGGSMGDPYSIGLADPYSIGLADNQSNAFGRTWVTN